MFINKAYKNIRFRHRKHGVYESKTWGLAPVNTAFSSTRPNYLASDFAACFFGNRLALRSASVIIHCNWPLVLRNKTLSHSQLKETCHSKSE